MPDAATQSINEQERPIVRVLHFERHELIYRAGDRAESAFIVQEGEVELSQADTSRQPERLGPGAVFGQVGIMVDQPRRRTARALTDVVVLAVPRADFLRALNTRYEVVEPFFRRLFSTLHDAENLAERGAPPPRQLSAETGTPGEAPPRAAEIPASGENFSIRLLPASDSLIEQLGADGLSVKGLPFRVGRQPEKGEPTPPGGLGLNLQDAKPFSLSRRHFIIEAGPEKPFVRDLGSHLGTIVNGTRIGGDEGPRTAPLDPGENSVIAGGESSPFAFKIMVSVS